MLFGMMFFTLNRSPYWKGQKVLIGKNMTFIYVVEGKMDLIKYKAITLNS